jgi:predicted MFS family arabinose efflux permease
MSSSHVAPAPSSLATATRPFTRYEKFVIAVLTFLNFTIVLDFMVLSPLGAILMPALNLSPSEFGSVVSAYAFSAGAAGILAAGFADRFDRKNLLLFFYVGFLVGTLCCAFAPNYRLLLLARIVTGLFGGVIGSIVLAITTDLFPMDMRGRVMGFVQAAFAASQVLGIPFALFLSNLWGWHAPFLMIVVLGSGAGLVLWKFLRPIRGHLRTGKQSNAFYHLMATVTRLRYLQGFAAMALLATGGFMLMPFSSAFSVNNVGISLHELPIVYMFSGVVSMFVGPFMGRLSDRIGKFSVFAFGSLLMMVMVFIYTHLGQSPLWLMIVVSIFLFMAVSTRMVASAAMISGVPDPQDRGAFMSVNSSIQQFSGGLAAALAGLIVVQEPGGRLLHFDTLGYVVIGAGAVTLLLMYTIQRAITSRGQAVAALS